MNENEVHADAEIVPMSRDEAVAIAQQLVELRREHAELAATLVPLMTAISEWMALRNAIVTSLLARPIQWAIAVCLVAALGALIWRGQAIDAFNLARSATGGTSIVVTGQAPSSHSTPDGSTSTP